MIEVVNRFVAVEPFQTTSVTASLKGGIAFIEQKVQLTKLKVVYPSMFVLADGKSSYKLVPNRDFIYVSSDQYVQPWAKRVLELEEGKPFVLVPYESVVLVEGDCF